MCGIAGIFEPETSTDAMASMAGAMAFELAHRGPDDSGTAAGNGWGLGARRLAIQDLSPAGHQPMRYGALTLAYNGEVYNFVALRRQLEALGHNFRSGSDTEVVLRAFAEWGPEAFARLNGMFALAVVDDRKRKAWIARDRFGKKPLFVARLGRRLAIASELKAIHAIAPGELTLNHEGLAGFFRFGYVPTPLSIFSQVEKLPAGSWAELDLETAELHPPVEFWRLPEASDSVVERPEDLLELIRDAVGRRLVADVPVGALLSGGVDSSLVVACMRDLAADVRTFSIGFEDPRYDESASAAAVAGFFGTNHTAHQLTSVEALALVPRLADVYDEPFADRSAIPTLAVSQLARESVTVVLSGDGGDELFGGYTRYALPLQHRIAARIPAAVGGPASSMVPGSAERGSLRSYTAAGSFADGYEDALAIWRRHDLVRLMPDVVSPTPVAERIRRASGGLVERMMRADAQTYLCDDILQKVDRASMAVSLEARNPLLDPAVVAYAFGAASAAESAPGQKQTLRDVLRLCLPEHLVDRPKRGFSVPAGEWLRGELRPLVEDLVVARSDAEYDINEARAVCRAHLAGERDATDRVWTLLMLELWRSRWL
jgi:asparagine synthase (glutamine-hydrolysing)